LASAPVVLGEQSVPAGQAYPSVQGNVSLSAAKTLQAETACRSAGLRGL
jgi:hypothetical protein